MNIKYGMQRSVGWLATMAAAGMLTAAPTEGATIVFDQVNNSGTVSYDGTAGGALIGTDILFQSIRGVDTDNDVTVDCTGCLLNFSTGPIVSVAGNDYTFQGGGSFSLVGGSVLGGIPGGTTLLSGTFDNPVTLRVTNSTLMMLAEGEDEKNEMLLDFFFINPPEDFRFIDSNIQIESAPNGVTKFAGPAFTGFTANLAVGGNADLVNSSVPEPGVVTLFLLGLAGVSVYRRRRG